MSRETPAQSTTQHLTSEKANPRSNVILIGMAGAGKTTIGTALAHRLGMAHIDTDHYLEAWWGVGLQELRDRLGREGFIAAESERIQELAVQHCVISTGGSVVYSPAGMRSLQQLGPIIGLYAAWETIAQRIAAAPQRGLAIAEGQTLEELYIERQAKYEAYSDVCIATDTQSVHKCVQTIEDWLHGQENGPENRT